MRIAVRTATFSDAGQVAQLVTSLGYPTSSSQMSGRLESILADEDYATLVACDDDQIVGFIGTRVGRYYESDGHYGQIMALAVSTTHRRRGIGRMLTDAAESILIARGARVVIVTSGHQRAGAHEFYERNGYEFTGRRYVKTVRA